MFTLRPYQQELIEYVWDAMHRKNNVLVVAPCGAGKTLSFVELCRRTIEFKPDVKILIVLNRVQLVEQTAREINKYIDGVGVYCGSLDSKEIKNVTVASIQSIYKQDLGKINMVIVDEAHHLSEDDESQYKILLNKLKHEKLKTIGFTASPWRPIGFLYGEGKFFDKIDFRIDLEYLIECGFLVRPRMKHVDHQFNTDGLSIKIGDYDKKELSVLVENEKKSMDQVTDAIGRLTGRKKIAWCCATIKQAEIVFDLLKEDAVIIHSKQSKNDQDSFKWQYENGSTRHLVFVSMFTEGVDIPCIDAIVMLRPTRSPVLYVQIVGRGLRLFNGKEDLLFLDYGQVVQNIGSLTNPHIRQARESKKSKQEPEHKVCPACFEYVPKQLTHCQVCNHLFFTERKTKLTEEPDQDSDILAKPKPREIPIKSVQLGYHRSKNGNECLRISYKPLNVLEQSYSEYFIFKSDWAYKKMMKRLEQLECPIVADVLDQCDQEAKRIPSSITLVKKNGYDVIEKVSF